MAGRPRRRIERLKQLVAAADKLERALLDAEPPLCDGETHKDDPVGEKWAKAHDHACWCEHNLELMLFELEERLERQAATNPLVALVDEGLDADEAQMAAGDGEADGEAEHDAETPPGHSIDPATAASTYVRVRPRAQGKEVPTDG